MAAESEGQGLGRWWAATIVAMIPPAVAAGWGVALLAQAPDVRGAAVLGSGLLLLLLELLLVQRAINRSLVPPPSTSEGDSAALSFARRALRLRRVEEVGAFLSSTVHNALAMERTLLVLPVPGAAKARVLGDPKASAETADDAYGYLASHPYPVRHDAADPEAEPVRQLCARLDVEVALGLRHRGELLGVLLLGWPQRPLDAHDLDLLGRLGLQATVAIANTHLFDEARGRASLSREVDLATAVVEHLLPPETLQRAGDVSVRGLSRPAAECGGDFWFWRRLPDGRGLLAIGDVTGHGLPAAVVAASAKGCCEASIGRGGVVPGPADILAALNRAVFNAGCGRYHMSCFVALLDGAHREVRFANAGHNFPYVVTPRAGEAPQLAQLVARGNTLGQVERAAYTEVTRPLAPGERLIFYTDGVVEAPSESGEPYSERRFRRILVERGTAPVEALTTGLYHTVTEHMGARPPADDITLVVAALEPGSGGAPA